MKIKMILLALFATTLVAQAQQEKRKLRAPAWITHSKNVDIVGLSLAAFPKDIIKNDTTLTRTFGVRVEPSIFGVFSFIIPKSPVSTTQDSFEKTLAQAPTEIIYGWNFSTGTFGETYVNGFSASLVMQYLYRMNGISVVGMTNMVESGNGIFIGGFGNDLYKGNGISLGLGNLGHRYNGIQIGMWNSIRTTGHGLQLGLENLNQQFKGVQTGIVNISHERMYGIQVGLWNDSKDLRGIQLGLWNKNGKRSLPFINWQFKS